MGKKSRQKRLRREMRPAIQAAVASRREAMASELKYRKLVPDSVEGLSQQNPSPSRPAPTLVMPTPLAVQAIEASRR